MDTAHPAIVTYGPDYIRLQDSFSRYAKPMLMAVWDITSRYGSWLDLGRMGDVELRSHSLHGLYDIQTRAQAEIARRAAL